jgi:N-methylhydantoinase A
MPLRTLSPEACERVFQDMASEGRAALAGEGYDRDTIRFRRAADLRYAGQSSQITVPMQGQDGGADTLRTAFERLYFDTFGYIAEDEPIELVNLRLSAIGTAASRLAFGDLHLNARALAGESGERLVSFARGTPRVGARLVARAAVEEGPIAGPAIVESYDTTIVIPPNYTARPAGAGCIAIDME